MKNYIIAVCTIFSIGCGKQTAADMTAMLNPITTTTLPGSTTTTTIPKQLDLNPFGLWIEKKFNNGPRAVDSMDFSTGQFGVAFTATWTFLDGSTCQATEFITAGPFQLNGVTFDYGITTTNSTCNQGQMPCPAGVCNGLLTWADGYNGTYGFRISTLGELSFHSDSYYK